MVYSISPNLLNNPSLRSYNTQKKRQRTLGHLLILSSLALLCFIYYPWLYSIIYPPPIRSKTSSASILSIPKIGVHVGIVENVDPWNPKAYQDALHLGVAEAKGTSMPPQKGTTFIFGHSSTNPWNSSPYSHIFAKLDQLKKGDRIIITKDTEEYNYKVVEQKVVSSSEVNFILKTDKDQLILQTCTPLGTSLKRLLVFAQRDD